jgi:hypothetical protein
MSRSLLGVIPSLWHYPLISVWQEDIWKPLNSKQVRLSAFARLMSRFIDLQYSPLALHHHSNIGKRRKERPEMKRGHRKQFLLEMHLGEWGLY